MIFTFLPELLRPKDDGAQTAPRRASQPRAIERIDADAKTAGGIIIPASRNGGSGR